MVLCVPVAISFIARLPLCELVLGLGVQEELSYIVLVEDVEVWIQPRRWWFLVCCTGFVTAPVVVLPRWVLLPPQEDALSSLS